jgi:hypothetical protein
LDLWDLPVLKVQQEKTVGLVQQVLKVTEVIVAQQVHKVQKVQQAPKDLKDHKVK